MGVVSTIQAELKPSQILSLAKFLLKFSNFRYHGNMGWSGRNFTCRVKFADPDNSLLDAGMGVVTPIQAELLPIFCQNLPFFVVTVTGLVTGCI